MKKRILVIDDDPRLIKLVNLGLTHAGYEVYKACDGQEGLREMYIRQPDLVILDIMMPGMDGWRVCRRIREMCDTPIIMLTAKAGQDDIVRGLEHGADDYMIKPFSVRELLARVRAVLRRGALPLHSEEIVVYSDEYLKVNLTESRVEARGERVKMTRTELRLLTQFVQNAGRVLTHRELLEKVWGPEFVDDVDYLHIYVWRLRQKIEEDATEPQYILTEHGVGYRFEKAE
ncbi:MAG: DNA-binding response regulator [Chloroflexi bacterium B3_Chlor]|nr:MAG: DNA-binding response regulator [Chloroflexi bacterium B3_Chlor]